MNKHNIAQSSSAVKINIGSDSKSLSLRFLKILHLQFAIPAQSRILKSQDSGSVTDQWSRKRLACLFLVKTGEPAALQWDLHTLSPISLSGLSSVCYKTTQNTGSVGRAGAAPPTYKLGKFLSWPLALSMLTYSNFQKNGASAEFFFENYCFDWCNNGYKKFKSYSRISIYLEIAIWSHKVCQWWRPFACCTFHI